MSTSDLSSYLPPLAEQKQIAAQQVEQFKRELYGHVLNQQRLDAVPAEARDEAHAAAVADAGRAIETIKKAIDATKAA